MFLIIKILFLCIFLVGANDVSFKEVTIAWVHDKSNNSYTEGMTYISSSNNLDANLPNTSSAIKVGVKSGSIPVLYENSVSDIQNFKKLVFNYVNLEEIRPRAFKNVKVRHLQLAYNSIKKLSKGIFENVEMEILGLEKNQISEIESGVFIDVKLSRLHLEYNKLEEINPNVFNISDLKYLELHENKIKILQAGDLQNLPKLERLGLSGNKLRTIGEGIFQNTILETLELGSNEISLVNPKSFDNMTELGWIDLSSNKLVNWDKNWFYNTPSLRDVFFSYNEIKEIPDKAFQNLDKVENLSLRRNQISKFSPNAFIKNEENIKVKIGLLSLIENNLTCIEGPLKDVFGSVRAVFLHSNPWDENCENKATVISNF